MRSGEGEVSISHAAELVQTGEKHVEIFCVFFVERLVAVVIICVSFADNSAGK